MLRSVRRLAFIAGFVLCTVLPCLPGRHDVLARPLSEVAQLVGVAGLVLVPIGLLWLVHGWWAPVPAARRVRRAYTLAALLMVALIAFLAALLAATVYGPSFGLALALACLALLRVAARRSQEPRRGLTPLDCIVVPAAFFCVPRVLAEPATEFARDRAIRNSAALLADIERYRAERGHYPPSLHSEWEDYSPGVLGIERYSYEPQGDAYNLFFESPSFAIGARVFTAYNPRDAQAVTSHNSDLLRLTPAELELQRGFIAVEGERQPHWKSFVFD